ncbi:ABC transporter permease [Occultella aeris]|uniref:ABC transporter permease YtrF n=1 Tax=Occultella aeris TaxID=2761496 RepID=A0A7M4DM33_9MICO|nr:ABC transporter permease [Occultella aeris]VZO38365.1 ABC transporter permease YtrF precursor [Occultella aeris]
MLRLTLAQMRTSAGRLAAAGIAILLGTAFVSVTLLASATLEQTTYNAVTAQLADADLVVDDPTYSLDADALDRIRETDGVAAADPMYSFGAELGAGGRTEWVNIGGAASDARLSPAVYTSGSAPAAAGEISLGVDIAERLGVQPGDEIEATWESWTPDPEDPESGTWAPHAESLRISGLIEENSGLAYGAPNAYVPADELTRWELEANESASTWSSILIAIDDGADAEATLGAVAAQLAGNATAEVLTVTEQAQRTTAEITGNDMTFVVLPLGFAAVALAVAALVIANTFQVLVAQRTRSLALLRCVGATKEQVRSTVLIEALVVGLVSSIAGLVLGTVLMAVGLAVVAELNLDVPLDRTLHVNAVSVIVPVLVGTVVTVLAALVPARIATRVAPLAALRPVEGEHARGAGRIRMAFALVLVAGGVGLLALAVGIAGGLGGIDAESGLLIALGIGVLGGLSTVLGLLIGTVFVVPALIRLAGRILSRWVPGRIATANAVRNPRRTGATASALFIGVALVTMMSTGAAAAKDSLGDALSTQYPVDVSVSLAGSDVALDHAQINAVAETDGVAESALLSLAPVTLGVHGSQEWVLAQSVELEDLSPVLRDPDVAAGLSDATIVMPRIYAAWYDLVDGDPVTVTAEDGSEVELTAVVTELGGVDPMVTPATFAALGLTPVENAMAVRLADDVDAVDTVREIQTVLTDLSATTDAPTASVAGAAVERAAFTSVVDTLLAVVLGMLAVSVVIALVGVANTLSLSVLERRRESALLRAMGLTRGQLRGMLAVEGVMIAGAGAALGIIAGLGFGWAGTAVMLSSVGEVTLAVPWRDLAIVVVIALVAGLLASVLPARTAARTPPVAALAMD